MKKIVHIITGLNNGGAETMLYKLLQNIDASEYQCFVVSMLDKGVMGKKIESLGISVLPLNMNKKYNILTAFFKTRKLCKDAEMIQSWMYHANLWAFFSSLGLHKKIIWGIRRGELSPSTDKKTTLFTAKVGAWISHRISTIVYCAENSKKFHEEKYCYAEKNSVVIPNGFELEKYKRSETSRAMIRNQLGIDDEKIVIALVGRYHVVKGHKNFCKALGLLAGKTKKEIHILFVGYGNTKTNSELMALIRENYLESRVSCMGARDDIPDLLSATDFLVSASYTEAFSNVIGEAMSCEVPCVVTDVGDSAGIVGNTGIVVPNNEPTVLANGIMEMISKDKAEREMLGKKARTRIQELFEIKVVSSKYEKLYKE